VAPEHARSCRAVSAHAWKNTGTEPGRVLFLYTPAGAGSFFEEAAEISRPFSSMNDQEIADAFQRHGWEVVGPCRSERNDQISKPSH
jgi:hypothetical protein